VGSCAAARVVAARWAFFNVPERCLGAGSAGQIATE
jgi:hypothetical protein